VDVHSLLAKESKRLVQSQADYATACVRYFAERGLDPVKTEAREGALIMQEVRKLGDRLFGYIKEQERGLFQQMLEEMLRTRITIDRVLRMNEILVQDMSEKLGQMSEAQLSTHEQALSVLRGQNEAMINAQAKEAILGAQKAGPGKGQSGKNART
jgi:hypothetical protein